MPRSLKVAIAIIVTAVLCVFIWEATILVRTMQDASKDLTSRLDTTLGNVDNAMIAVQGIQRDTTRTEYEMAGLLNQTRHSMVTAKQERTLVDHAELVLEDSDRSVKQFGDAAAELGDMAKPITATVQAIGDDSHAALVSLDEDIASPDLHDTMAQIDQSAKNASAATASAADALKTTNEVVHKEADQLLKPVSKAEQIAHIAIRGVGWFLGY